MGEAMLLCTSGERAFVVALVISGGQDQSLAAFQAGHGTTKEIAAQSATQMMRRPRVLAAIREEADRRLRSGALLASSALYEIIADTKHKDRFKASVEVLNRAGMLVETHHRITVDNDTRSVDQIKKEVELLLARVFKGQPLPAALTAPLEGQFSEVLSDEGLEDFLGTDNSEA